MKPLERSFTTQAEQTTKPDGAWVRILQTTREVQFEAVMVSVLPFELVHTVAEGRRFSSLGDKTVHIVIRQQRRARPAYDHQWLQKHGWITL